MAYVALFYGAVLPIQFEVKGLLTAMGFLLGGLTASAFHEVERWFADLSDVYGSAAFATPTEARRAGLYSNQGVLLGRHGRRLIRFNQPGHVLTLAPTRSGKGTCGVIPNLLEYPGSVVTVDIKGENVAIAGRRRADFGPVYKFAPFDADSHCFNPFDFIRSGEDAWEGAAMLADMLVVPSGSSKSMFFENEARALLTGMILFVATEAPADRRNLATVRRLVMAGEDKMAIVIGKMRRAGHAVVRRTANSFAAKEPKLKSSILAEIQTHTLILDSERVARVTSRSDFSLEALKGRTASLFLVIPPQHLNVTGR